MFTEINYKFKGFFSGGESWPVSGSSPSNVYTYGYHLKSNFILGRLVLNKLG